MVGIGHAAEFVGVGIGHLVVHAVALQMRAAQQAQAAVVRRGIDEIVHQEKLLGQRRITRRIVPAPPVLMPKQRRAIGRFADDVARHPPRAQKAQGFERGTGGRVGDEFGEDGVDTNINHAASGALLGADFLALGVEQLIGDLAQTLENIVVEDVSYQAIAVADELVEVFFGVLYGHRRRSHRSIGYR